MKELKVEASDISVGAGYRPGTVVVKILDPALQRFDTQELLGQMDIKEVIEWISGLGYEVKEVGNGIG